MRSELEKISDCLANSQSIAILTHISLDGDCLGAGIALAAALKNRGKDVLVITDALIPGSLSFLPRKELVTNLASEEFIPDMTVVVDCGDKERFEDRKKLFKSAKITANIDHHRTNTSYADLNYVDRDRSSASELVFELLKVMNAEITNEIATCLYVGLVTDTGGFKHANTNIKTHLCAAELLGYGLNIATLSQNIFVYTTESMLKLTARALSSLQLEYEKRLAVVSVSAQDFDECHAERSETEGFADFGRALSSVIASVSMREFEKGKIKISMRSKGSFDVAKIAQKFDGGGHINAAGCSITGTLENAKACIIEAFDELKSS